MGLTIRTKILGSLLLVALLFIVILLYVQSGLHRISDQEVTYNLQSGRRAYERFSELHDNLLTSQARALAQTPHLKAVLNIPDVDHETVYYSARMIYEVSDIPFMLLTDAQGYLLADPQDPGVFDNDLRSLAGIKAGIDEGQEYNGVWNYEGRLYRITLTPVLATGRIIGLLILGLPFDADLATEVREVTGRDVLILQAGKVVSKAVGHADTNGADISPIISEVEQAALSIHLPLDNTSALPFRVILGDNECLAVSVPLPDQAGHVVLFRALKEVESEVGALRTFVLGAGGMSCLLMIAFSIWLSNRVTQPLRQITKNAHSIARGTLNFQAFSVKSNDEISALVYAFRDLFDFLEKQVVEITKANEQLIQSQEAEKQLHTQLQDISRQAGMAEVATGVLHNVGNVLNSANISTTLIRERIKGDRLGNLERIADLLNEHEKDLGSYITGDAKGQLIPEYLTKLATSTARDRKALLTEVDGLIKNINHIKEIVAMHQNYAKNSGVTEILPIDEAIDEAVYLMASSSVRHGIKVERQYEPIPPVLFDKHKFQQILINLLTNAHQALKESDQTERCIWIHTVLKDQMRLCITVRDNGRGILQENLTRIFSHGFTTRETGHGFGLHSAALAATDMKGSLNAASDGPDEGATFTLDLPFCTEQLAKKNGMYSVPVRS